MTAGNRHGARWSCLHELCARLSRRSNIPGKAGIASSGLIGECSTVSAVGKCQKQEHNHGDDGHACPPANTHGLLRLRMEIKPTWRFDWLVFRTIVCVHG